MRPGAPGETSRRCLVGRAQCRARASESFFALLGRGIALASARGAGDVAISGKGGALRHQTVGGHQTTGADSGTAEHEPAVLDPHAVTNGAAVDNAVLADPHVGANLGGVPR